MNIGYIGNGPFAAAAVQRLLGNHKVAVFSPAQDRTLQFAGVRVAANAREIAQGSDVLVLCLASHADVRELLGGSDGLAQELSAGKVIIDQSPGEPAEARALAEELRQRGVILLDAPVHSEVVDAPAEIATLTCGGPVDAFESMRPLLASLCPNVVYCGDSGSGRAANLVVGAVAACNRLITYECASVGVKNGLALEHMAAVLNQSSGANSASARVLPALGERSRTADLSLSAAAHELKLASRLAMQCGAPLLFGNVAGSMYLAAASRFGATSTLDDLASCFEAAGGIRFQDAKTRTTVA